MKILVTGATGIIGRSIIEHLLHTDHEIVATSTGTQEFSFPQTRKLTFIPCNLNEDRNDHAELFGKPDALIDTAWEKVPVHKDPAHIERCVFAHYRLVKNLTSAGTKNITMMGTSHEYGMLSGCLCETMYAEPLTGYAIAKHSLRLFIMELEKQNDFTLKWIRQFHTYGKGHKDSILGKLDAALERGETVFPMSGGEQLRDFMPVEIAVANIVKISLQTKYRGIVNNCSGKPISVRRFVEEYLASTGKKIEIQLGHYPYPQFEPMAFWGDATKLTQIIAE